MKIDELINSERPRFWKIFRDIFSSTYRESKHEELIRGKLKKYFEELKQKHVISDGAELLEDEIGNILIKIPSNRKQKADLGKDSGENKAPLLIQAHLDMVCEKNADINFDFKTQPLNLKIVENEEGNWLTAEGTTLGADNGIGASMLLSLLTDLSNIEHGDLEFLFTIDEETGLTGALELDVAKLGIKSKNLINIDSEEFGNITIGSAGGGGVYISQKFVPSYFSKNSHFYKIRVSGLKGGHSGADIHLPRANANVVVASILSSLLKEIKYNLISWNGGNKTNAIPRDSACIIALNDKGKDNDKDNEKDSKKDNEKDSKKDNEKDIDKDNEKDIDKDNDKDKGKNSEKEEEKNSDITSLFDTIRKRFYDYYKTQGYEPDMLIELLPEEKIIDRRIGVLSDEDTQRVVYFTHLIRHGYIRFSPSIKDLVETSQNFAVININHENNAEIDENGHIELEIKLSVRSSIGSELEEVRLKMTELAQLVSFNAETGKSYPGWTPDPNSPFLNFIKHIYQAHCDKFNLPLTVGAIHAGLETGFIGAKIEGMQMVSIGPTIIHPHSPDESVNIQEAEMFYQVLMDIIRQF